MKHGNISEEGNPIAVTHKPIFAQTPQVTASTVTGAAADVLIATAGSDGANITALVCTVNAAYTTARTLSLKINDSIVGDVVIPVGAGLGGTIVSVNLLKAASLAEIVQADGSLSIPITGTVKVIADASVTGIIAVTAFFGDY